MRRNNSTAPLKYAWPWPQAPDCDVSLNPCFTLLQSLQHRKPETGVFGKNAKEAVHRRGAPFAHDRSDRNMDCFRTSLENGRPRTEMEFAAPKLDEYQPHRRCASDKTGLATLLPGLPGPDIS